MTHVGVPTEETFLVTPNFGPGGSGTSQQGLMMLDGRGELVWFQPLDPAFTQPAGADVPGPASADVVAGHLRPRRLRLRTGYVADAHYATIATVTAGNALADSGSVPRSGFETAITVHPKRPFLAVRGLDRTGALLATSEVVQL